MTAFLGIFAAVLLLIALVFGYIKYLELKKIKDQFEKLFLEWQDFGTKADSEIKRLSKYEGIANIDDQIEALKTLSRSIDEENKKKTANIDAFITEKEDYAFALKRLIEGYSNEFIIPEITILDELAEDYGYTEAAKSLKEIKGDARKMIRTQTAAVATAPMTIQKESAQRFILEAFNGKVEEAIQDIKNENYGVLSQQIKDCFRAINEDGAVLGVHISKEYLDNRLAELKAGMIVYQIRLKDREEQQQLKEIEREEAQARREEERRRKEQEKKENELKELEIEKAAAVERAKREWEQANESDKEYLRKKLERTQLELEVAHDKTAELQKEIEGQPTIAQLKSSGHVYIITNYGSFGEDVVKIGMTRRQVEDRVYELGDASVPFTFDIEGTLYHHEDALELEAQIHDMLIHKKLNRLNPRKEFFKITISELKKICKENSLDVKWTISSEAKEWKEKKPKREWERNKELLRQHEQDPKLYEMWLEKRRKR